MSNSSRDATHSCQQNIIPGIEITGMYAIIMLLSQHTQQTKGADKKLMKKTPFPPEFMLGSNIDNPSTFCKDLCIIISISGNHIIYQKIELIFIFQSFKDVH